MTKTECSQESFGFQEISKREVVARFDGGVVTSDAGALLVREVAEHFGVLERFGECFTDYRKPEAIEFSVKELVSQRLYGMICGYGDLNDHDSLRGDPLFAVLVGREDVKGEHREKERDRGKALAGRATLNRLELSEREIKKEERYKKISCDESKVEDFLVETFLGTFKRTPRMLILDCDAHDVPLHGNQEGRYYHGYYNNYCYLPLLIYCGEMPLAAKLRSSNIDASAGTVEELKRIVPLIRGRFPKVKIIVRGDSGFAREEIMHYCEENGLDFIIGLAKNARLNEEIKQELQEVKERFEATKEANRKFKDFKYRTLNETWSRERRVIGKAEHLAKGSNPRFVVTSLSRKMARAMKLYEQWYCARGEMENNIKEQLMLFSDRLSAGVKRANQVRLWFSTVAYMLMVLVRRYLLQKTALAKAQVQTIREKLLKIGAIVTVSVRRVYLSMASGFPFQETFTRAWAHAQLL